MSTQKALNLNTMTVATTEPDTTNELNLTKHKLAGLNHDALFDILDLIEHTDRQQIYLNRQICKTNKNIDKHKPHNPQTNPNKESLCPECLDDGLVVEDSSFGIVVCTGCGTVMSNVIDRKPEWKQYDNDGGSNVVGRCSMPINYFFPQSSLGTSIGGRYMSKVKILHSWSAMPYKERSLYLIFKEIQNGCRRADILKCIEDDAKILCKNISECKHIKGENKGKKIINRGKNRRGLIAACVFFACRRKGVTRSPKEIADVFNLKFTEITRGCKLFLKMMQLVTINYDLNTSTAQHFIPRFCHMLHLEHKYIQKTVQIAINIQRLNVASVHTPLSIATGSILLMANINGLKHITKKMISKRFEVTEVTVTKTFNKLKKYKKILVNDAMTDLLVRLMVEGRRKAVISEEITAKYNFVAQAAAYDDRIKKEEDDDGLDLEEDQPYDPHADSLEAYIDRFNHRLNMQIDECNKGYQEILVEYSDMKRRALKTLR